MKKINKNNQRKIYSNLQTLQVQPTSELCKKGSNDTCVWDKDSLEKSSRSGVQHAHSGSDCCGLISPRGLMCKGKVSDSFWQHWWYANPAPQWNKIIEEQQLLKEKKKTPLSQT